MQIITQDGENTVFCPYPGDTEVVPVYKDDDLIGFNLMYKSEMLGTFDTELEGLEEKESIEKAGSFDPDCVYIVDGSSGDPNDWDLGIFDVFTKNNVKLHETD